MTPNINRCIDLIYNESTSAGCGKKGKKSKTFSAIIIILLANWLANKGGALQTKAFAPSILHTAIKLCPEHILEFCPFRYISRSLPIKKIKQNITYKYMVTMEAGSYII